MCVFVCVRVCMFVHVVVDALCLGACDVGVSLIMDKGFGSGECAESLW